VGVLPDGRDRPDVRPGRLLPHKFAAARIRGQASARPLRRRIQAPAGRAGHPAGTATRKWIMGDDYTIADIATLGWVRNMNGFYEAGELVDYGSAEARAALAGSGLWPVRPCSVGWRSPSGCRRAAHRCGHYRSGQTRARNRARPARPSRARPRRADAHPAPGTDRAPTAAYRSRSRSSAGCAGPTDRGAASGRCNPPAATYRPPRLPRRACASRPRSGLLPRR
jgi:hypothetical protein